MTGISAVLASPYPSYAVTLSDQTISKSGAGNQAVSYAVNSDRTISSQDGFLETWLANGNASDYDVRATHLSGGLGGGSFGFWINLTSNAQWSLLDSSANGSGVTSAIRIEISRHNAATAIATATINLSANRTS
jgi:hypothetical protein